MIRFLYSSLDHPLVLPAAVFHDCSCLLEAPHLSFVQLFLLFVPCPPPLAFIHIHFCFSLFPPPVSYAPSLFLQLLFLPLKLCICFSCTSIFFFPLLLLFCLFLSSSVYFKLETLFLLESPAAAPSHLSVLLGLDLLFLCFFLTISTSVYV